MDNRILRVLSIKSFFFLWLAEIFSQIAMNMINFILIIVSFELTKSNTAVSGIVLSYTIPAILFGVAAGAYVDYWDKKKVLFITNISRAVLLVLLAFFNNQIVVLYAISFLIAIATQFFIPAETPMIPVVVPKDLLFSANAFFGMGVYGSILIAYALSGPFLVFFGKMNVFLILAFLFLIASVFVQFIKLEKHKDDEKLPKTLEKISFVSEMKEAFAIVTKTKVVYHSLFLLTLSQILILMLAVLGPGYATHVLNISVDNFPLLFVTPAAAGMVVAAVVLIKYFHNAPKVRLANVGVFLSAIAMFLMPFGSKVMSEGLVTSINQHLPALFSITVMHFMIVLAFILGIANALVFVPSNTIIQEKTSESMRGKIYGALNAITGLFSLIPIIIVGGLADIFGVSAVITWIAIFIFLIGIFRVVVLQKVLHE